MTNKYSFIILCLCLFFCHGVYAQTNAIKWTDKTSSIQNNTLDEGTDPEDTPSSPWQWGTKAVKGWKLTGIKGSNGAWTPEQNKFYHMVGVYDRDARTITLYRDGKKMGSSVSAKGKMVLAKSSDTSDPYKYHKFTLVGDPAYTHHEKEDICAQTIPSEVVMARMYDKVLTEAEIQQLYAQVKPLEEYEGTTGSKDQSSTDLVTNVQYVSEVDALSSGSKFIIYADGLQSGDYIEFTNANASSSATKATTFTSRLNIMPAKTAMQRVSAYTAASGSASCTLPTTAATYKMTLTRGGKTQNLGYMRINKIVDQLNYGQSFGIVAHRGVHTSAPENSREGLRAALDANYYGSETDIRMSSDGTLFIIHDEYFDKTNHKSSTESTDNLKIENNTASTIKSGCTLTNGEVLPTLGEFLDIMKEEKYSGKSTKLVIEIKTNKKESTYINNTKAAAKAAMDLVHSKGLDARVEYIAFSWETCKYLATYASDQGISNVSIQYLSNNSTSANYGAAKTQSEMKSGGITGIDYQLAVADKVYTYNSQTYNTFHNDNMTVNVWTINTLSEANEALRYGCDYITTNIPADLVMLKEYYDLNNNKQ